MKINVLFSPANVDELYFAGKTTVVIDVLRATSTIITALQNGAREIIPVATVEFAVKVSGGMFGGLTLLGGERNTKKIEGFALGNSPFEYTSEIVSGKSIIFYTTNGTKAIVKAKFSETILICSFLNVSAVAKKLIELNNDVEILCSGRSNVFSLEDVICSGKLVSEISKQNKNIELMDSALASIALNEKLGNNIYKMMKESEHGKILVENGFEKDIKYCSQIDVTSAVPINQGNVLKLMPETDEKSSDKPEL
jgi:2-phosphosulfolactate phosphatase